ncbi:hypothetical protein B0I33_1018 [Prauserella shujinwangii]|uniref:EVE domain-containing protein n=1 Tax=Prauserella shujinwangii TaxID=1453103 RepID=A0A2T0M296_9PSEU|nr:hypothetical protein [Prauserella shujinwangii]PRX50857.1 hypothetical protein B0I33_1018 [Prauserella shujinwangii]
MAHYLLVIGDREALGWVLTEQRMAFPGFGRTEVRALTSGDTLLLYTTRGCFKNPTRDRGRVIAAGTARTAVATLEQPVEIAGRSYPVGCHVEFSTATPWPGGVELGPLVDELDTFADLGRSWSIRLRRPLVRLTDRDAGLLHRRLDAAEPEPLGRVLDQYARWWRSGPFRA